MDEDRKKLYIEHARILYRNFSGAQDRFTEGVRKFSVRLDDDKAQELKREGWNIKWTKDPENPRPYLEVKISYAKYEPKIIQYSGSGETRLTEKTVGLLDQAEFKNVDLVISPSFWEMNGKSGIKAYLDRMYVTLDEAEWESKYRRVPDQDPQDDR